MKTELDEFTEAFLVALLWSSGEEFDGKGIADIEEETLARIVADCRSFQDVMEPIRENHEERCELDPDLDCVSQWPVARDREYSDPVAAMAGHNFALTRNGHGAGFWDGDYPENDGKALTELSGLFPALDLYVGDDGKLYTL